MPEALDSTIYQNGRSSGTLARRAKRVQETHWTSNYTVSLDRIAKQDLETAGGKGANLGEMLRR